VSTWLTTAFTSDTTNRTHLVELTGEFDRSADDRVLESAVRLARTDPGASWLIDASGLTFADLAFVRFVERIDDELLDGSLRTIAPPSVSRLLRVLGVSERLGLMESGLVD
jgi:anti-anti-sigma regulatory factor